MKYDPTHASLFDNVVFLVEATDTEYHGMWVDYSDGSLRPMLKDHTVRWCQEPIGHSIQIGTIARRPVVVSIRYAIIEDQRVLFYCGCSQVVDHQMISDWLEHFSGSLNSYKDAHGLRNCNAMNFHNCMHFLKRKDK